MPHELKAGANILTDEIMWTLDTVYSGEWCNTVYRNCNTLKTSLWVYSFASRPSERYYRWPKCCAKQLAGRTPWPCLCLAASSCSNTNYRCEDCRDCRVLTDPRINKQSLCKIICSSSTDDGRRISLDICIFYSIHPICNNISKYSNISVDTSTLQSSDLPRQI